LVYIVGNGGSAAIASHVAIDLTKASKIPAMTFHDPALLTCLSNDFGYELWAEKALNYFAHSGDTAIFISSSGKSPNIINAVKKAKELGLYSITFSGFEASNPLRKLGDINFWVESNDYNVVELTHNVWLCSIIDIIAGKKYI